MQQSTKYFHTRLSWCIKNARAPVALRVHLRLKARNISYRYLYSARFLEPVIRRSFFEHVSFYVRSNLQFTRIYIYVHRPNISKLSDIVIIYSHRHALHAKSLNLARVSTTRKMMRSSSA